MSELSFHPLIQRDLRQILDHYSMEGGSKLADRFFAEAEVMVERIRSNPGHFHFVDEWHRRANFKTFPYHCIYEVRLNAVRINVLRHHSRRPQYGMRRK